jgi:NADPH:quinone reductase-like Zn-dependent oxidoreductase
MKAIVQDRYGSPEVLRVGEVDKPAPGKNEMLVRVKAAAVNARDWHLMRGDPYLARLAAPMLGLGAPKTRIRGSDFAGVVEAVGRNVTGFRAGDEVYGDLREADGAFAEYLCVPEALAGHKPANLTFQQAATVPLAASTALRGLRDTAQVKPGQRVLINGASGGVGTFAVQMAKAFGATVTAVCRTRNVELVRSLGADTVIDYTREDFTRGGKQDVVFDLVGNRSLKELRRVLAPGGTIVLSGGGVSGNGKQSLLGPMGLMLRGTMAGRLSRDRIRVLSEVPPGQDLAALTELIEAGKLVPAIDRTYPIEQVPEAIRYVEREHARAKVVIVISD